MKILHLLYESRGDSFGIGGVGIRAYELYRRLKDRHDITLLCKKYPGARDTEIEGLRHIFVGTESRSLTATLLSYAFHSSRFVRRYGSEFDVIIEEFSPGIPTLLGFYKRRPVVLQLQGYTGKKYFEKYNIFHSSVLYLLERLLPKTYDRFLLVSEATKKRYGLDNSHVIKVISNGINEQLFTVEPGVSDYILYLGRIDIHHKGLDLLLDAFAHFHQEFPDMRLVVAGDGKDRKKFCDLLEGLPAGVGSKIEMTGWVEGEEKNRLLKDALMVAVPSRYETQGIVALEAMASGKAIVASDIPELGYISDAGAGLSFRSGNVHSLASAMTTLASGDDFTAMGRKGREWVRRFTWGKISLDYENFLIGVLNDWNRQGRKNRN